MSVAAPDLSRASGDEDRPRLPRAIAALIIGAIAAASLAALLWPELPFARPFVGPTRIGVVTAQIEAPGAAGVVGDTAPDFEWATPEGGTVRLADLRGHPVVVNFWATWCLPCREEMPALDRAAQADPQVRFIALDLDEDGDKVRSFFDHLALTKLEPVLDVGSRSARRFGVVSLPTTFFVDAAGIVRQVELGGPMTDQVIRAAIGKVR